MSGPHRFGCRIDAPLLTFLRTSAAGTRTAADDKSPRLVATIFGREPAARAAGRHANLESVFDAAFCPFGATDRHDRPACACSARSETGDGDPGDRAREQTQNSPPRHRLHKRLREIVEAHPRASNTTAGRSGDQGGYRARRDDVSQQKTDATPTATDKQGSGPRPAVLGNGGMPR